MEFFTIFLAVLGALCTPFVLIPAFLKGLGFTAFGIAAGSYAALIQSWLGGVVVAKGFFATCMSVGAAGLSIPGMILSGILGSTVFLGASFANVGALLGTSVTAVQSLLGGAFLSMCSLVSIFTAGVSWAGAAISGATGFVSSIGGFLLALLL